MAKNTSLSGFRKIDIDIYNPENYNEDDVQNIQEDLMPNESEIVSLINSKRSNEALSLVLKNPPLNSKNQQVKDAVLNLVMRVLRSFPNSLEIDNAVKSLSDEALDVLMKYIYRGFEKEPRDSAQLLTWHEKVYAIGGNGCIVRVLTDRKRV
ncbi:actin-related 2 3 complex subunit 5 [Brachionus plicatilis]|uniref:Actin-related protein 2/3 complex subunit 5 n=1 Tax=Brachionus plicatilis TaxID=10195 RepID=A0A3M7P2B0_BRAPC|nr:actin-related 2 3 complex subunit 5 [Brachionus plicatilis]